MNLLAVGEVSLPLDLITIKASPNLNIPSFLYSLVVITRTEPKSPQLKQHAGAGWSFALLRRCCGESPMRLAIHMDYLLPYLFYQLRAGLLY